MAYQQPYYQYPPMAPPPYTARPMTYPKKRYPKKKGNNYKSRIRKQASKGNIRTGGVLKPELKWYDRVGTKALGTTLANVLAGTETLNTIGQDTTANTRIGDKAVVKQIQLHMQLTLLGLESTNDTIGRQMCRVMCIIDHQCNGTIANADDILEDEDDILSFRDLTTTARFTVLMDKTIVFNPQQMYLGTAGSHLIGPQNRVCNFYRGMSMLCQFDSPTANVVSSLTNNAILLFAMVDKGTPAVTLEWFSRCRYVG